MATEVASLTALLSLDDSGFTRGMRNAEQKISGIGGTFQNMGASLKNLGGNLQSMGMQASLVTAPIAAMGIVGVTQAMAFEDALKQIEVRAGLTADQMGDIEDKAYDLSRATQYGPTQIADAFLQLVTTGSSAEEAMAQLDAVIIGASANGTDLAFTADALTDIMSAMGLGVEDSAKAMQTLTNATSVSSADFVTLAEGFSNIGPAAATFGLSVEEVSATLALFNNNQIKGAEAGTQLRSLLNNMTRTTGSVTDAWDALGTSFYNADGSMRNFDDVIKDINTGLADKTPEEANKIITALAGTYGQMGLSTLLASNGISTTVDAMADGADIADLADARMETFSGAVSFLQGSVEELNTRALKPFMDTFLKPIVLQIASVVNQFSVWYESNQQIGNIIIAVLGGLVAVGPVLMAIGTAASIAGTAISVLGGILGVLFSPIGLIVAAVAALALAFVTDFGGIRTWFEANIMPWFSKLWEFLTEAVGSAVTWVNDTIVQPIVGVFQALMNGGDLMTALKDLGGIFLNVIADGITFVRNFHVWVFENVIKPIADAVVQYVNSGQLVEDLQALGAMFLDAIAAGITFLQNIGTWLYDNLIAPIIDATGGETGPVGQVWQKLSEFGQMFLDAIGNGLTFFKDIATWLYDNLIAPLFGGVEDQTKDGSEMSTALADLGKIFLDQIANGLTFVRDVGVWLRETLMQPIINAIGNFIGVGDLYDKLIDLGGSLLTAMADGIGNISTWIYDTFIKPIEDEIKNINILGWNPFGEGEVEMRANGGPVMAGNPYIVGEVGPELFVPSSSGTIIPNDALGGRIEIGTININATGDVDGAQLARSFEQELAEIMRSRG
jgi:TP901 family phage tail tape measure protein